MPDLLSIAPLTATVPVRGDQAIIRGVEVQTIADLLFRFPDLRKMWARGNFQIEPLLGMSDTIIAALIAAGCSNIDEANAKNLSLDEKAELLAAIVRVTMPRGAAPFVAALTEMAGPVGGRALPTVR
ncbi:hypothetical protein EN981_36910, partial [Mesorhizobium sp. M7A.F.Ca.CA.001.13.2.1]